MAGCIIYCCFCEYIILYIFVVYILKINLLVGWQCTNGDTECYHLLFPPFFLYSWETFILCGSSSNQCLSTPGFPKVLFFFFPSVWHLFSLPPWSSSFCWVFSCQFHIQNHLWDKIVSHIWKWYIIVRFEVHTIMLLKIQVIWDVMLCWLVSRYWCFEGLLCLHV